MIYKIRPEHGLRPGNNNVTLSADGRTFVLGCGPSPYEVEVQMDWIGTPLDLLKLTVLLLGQTWSGREQAKLFIERVMLAKGWELPGL